MRHVLVRALIQHYAERAGHPGRIRVFTRREPFDRLCRGRKATLDSSERAAYAVTLHGKTPVVWVNIPLHRTIAELSATAAHEAVHIVAGPAVPCQRKDGRTDGRFERRVRNLLRGDPPTQMPE